MFSKVFSTEWGNLERIFQQKPSLKQNLGDGDVKMTYFDEFLL